MTADSRVKVNLSTWFDRTFGTPLVAAICTNLQNKEQMSEALYTTKFKFPDYQKPTCQDESEDMVAEKLLIPKGCSATYITSWGPWTNNSLINPYCYSSSDRVSGDKSSYFTMDQLRRHSRHLCRCGATLMQDPSCRKGSPDCFSFFTLLTSFSTDWPTEEGEKTFTR
ncbi:hypothetical protein A6R68_20844, partial [Neotoma lepida]